MLVCYQKTKHLHSNLCPRVIVCTLPPDPQHVVQPTAATEHLTTWPPVFLAWERKAWERKAWVRKAWERKAWKHWKTFEPATPSDHCLASSRLWYCLDLQQNERHINIFKFPGRFFDTRAGVKRTRPIFTQSYFTSFFFTPSIFSEDSSLRPFSPDPFSPHPFSLRPTSRDPFSLTHLPIIGGELKQRCDHWNGGERGWDASSFNQQHFPAFHLASLALKVQGFTFICCQIEVVPLTVLLQVHFQPLPLQLLWSRSFDG